MVLTYTDFVDGNWVYCIQSQCCVHSVSSYMKKGVYRAGKA